MGKLLFSDWFLSQHGPRERNEAMAHLSDDDLKSAIGRGQEAEKELRRRELWDEKMTSALYAWQVDRK